MLCLSSPPPSRCQLQPDAGFGSEAYQAEMALPWCTLASFDLPCFFRLIGHPGPLFGPGSPAQELNSTLCDRGGFLCPTHSSACGSPIDSKLGSVPRTWLLADPGHPAEWRGPSICCVNSPQAVNQPILCKRAVCFCYHSSFLPLSGASQTGRSLLYVEVTRIRLLWQPGGLLGGGHCGQASH